jgi:ferredoxin
MTIAKRIVADPDVCIGSGNCVRMADEVFEQDDDGRVVINPEGDADPEVVELAVDGCPVGALSLD